MILDTNKTFNLKNLKANLIFVIVVINWCNSFVIYIFVNQFSVVRNRELDFTANEFLTDGMLYSNDKKEQLEVTIGEGMEFTIHGKLQNFQITFSIWTLSFVS